MRRLLFLGVFSSSLLVCQAVADQVTLKNGDRITGTIVKSDVKTVGLHTDYAGDVTLKWDAVQSIQTNEPLHVELQNGKTEVGTVTTSDGKLDIATAAGNVEAAKSDVKNVRNGAEQTAYEKTLNPGLLRGWKTGLNAGFALTGGNSETTNLSVGFIGTRQTLHDKLGLYANSVYAKNNVAGAIPSTTANTEAGGLRYDHDVTKDMFGFVGADFFAEALQGLNLRSVFGGGAGLHAIKNDCTTLDLLGGVGFNQEYFAFAPSYSSGEFLLGDALNVRLTKALAFTQAFQFFPSFTNGGQYHFNGSATLSANACP